MSQTIAPEPSANSLGSRLTRRSFRKTTRPDDLQDESTQEIIPPPSGWLNPEKRTKHIVLAGPAWVTTMLLELLCRFLERFNCEIHLIHYRGHFGDTTSDVSQHTLETYVQDGRDCLKHLYDIIGLEPVYGIGISMGSPVIHQLAQENPSRFCGVTLFGSPMMGYTPKWMTLIRVVLNPWYIFPILARKGKISLKRNDIQDLLFDGFENTLIDGICKTSAGGKVVSQMLFGQIKPNVHEYIAYTVIGAKKERFHSNKDKERWVKKGENTRYIDAEGDGSHFGTLLSEGFHKQILYAINSAHRAWVERKRTAEGPPTKVLGVLTDQNQKLVQKSTGNHHEETLYGGVEGGECHISMN